MSGQKIKNGRDLARAVLCRVRRDKAYANLALSAALEKNTHLPVVEKNLATELVYGVLRHQRRLDHALSQFLRKPLNKIDEESIDALRMAAYQILLLERIPAHAAVNDAVGAIRRSRNSTLAGLANAVLRKLTPQILAQNLPDDEVARLAIESSLSDELAHHFTHQLGIEQAKQLGQCLLERAPLVARINTLRATCAQANEALRAEGANLLAGSFCPTAVQIKNFSSPFASPTYWQGLWTVQDESAQLVSLLVDPKPGESIIDACAGLGGKSAHLAALMENRGQIFCLDSAAHKLQLHEEHCRRLGVDICKTKLMDLRETGSLKEQQSADRILLDAPCSGLGVLRRHPEHKWQTSLSAVGELATLQREMIKTLFPMLRPGGVFVYSVCTTTEEEGPQQIAWIKEQLPQLVLTPPQEPFWQPLLVQGCVRLWPHLHHSDGFFMARFIRR